MRPLPSRRAAAPRTPGATGEPSQAFHDGRASTDEAWRKVKAFREADAAVIHYLSDAECKRLVNATQGRFRGMRVADFNLSAGTVTVRLSKAGKPP